MSRQRSAVMALIPLCLLAGPAGAQTADAPAGPPPAPDAGANAPSPPLPADTVMLHRSATVLGQAVHSEDGKATGRIVDVLVDSHGHPRAAVIDFGGFLGLGTRRIAVDWSRIRFATGGTDPGTATVDLTLAQLQAAPDYKDTKGPVPVLAPRPPPAAADPTPVPTPPAPPAASTP